MGSRALRKVEGRRLGEDALTRLGAPLAKPSKVVRQKARPFYQRLHEAALKGLTAHLHCEYISPYSTDLACFVAPSENFLALFAINTRAGSGHPRFDGVAVGKNCKPVVIANEVPYGDLSGIARRESIARGFGGIVMPFKPRLR